MKTHKTCTTPGCGRWPIGCFTRDPASPDGRERRCKACRYERRADLAGGHARAVAPWALKFARGYTYRSTWGRVSGVRAAARRGTV